MEPPKERIFRGYLSSADVERLYPARVARIARGELTYAERGSINEEMSCIDREWRRGMQDSALKWHTVDAAKGTDATTVTIHLT